MVKVVPGAEPIALEIIETAIVDLAIGMRKLNSTRLKRDTIVALLHDRSKVPKRTIEIILNNLEDVENAFLKPKAKP